jgi:hypothetical protein
VHTALDPHSTYDSILNPENHGAALGSFLLQGEWDLRNIHQLANRTDEEMVEHIQRHHLRRNAHTAFRRDFLPVEVVRLIFFGYPESRVDTDT